MRVLQLAALLSACTFVTLGDSPLFAFALNFTSGLPPVGDGESYPRHINPARQAVGGGASPGSFLATIGVSFNNLNGNPAYFDGNNLLTRPATLINNEAFWTDPKLGQFQSDGSGSFEIAQFGFDFTPGFTDGLDFGFDLAMASVSTDLPTSSFYDELTGSFITAPYLPFQIQDDNFNTAQGALVFASGATTGPEEGVIFAESFGTFNSLNSPRTAYEARFRLDQTFLQELIAYEYESIGGDPGGGDDGGFGDDGFVSGPIQFFDIDFAGIATPGGTTQVAMDNFVLGASSPINDPLREPLTYQPLQPVGDNRPQYFQFTDENPFGDIDPTDTINLVEDVLLELSDFQIYAPIATNPAYGTSKTVATSVTIPVESRLRDDSGSGEPELAGMEVEFNPLEATPASVYLEAVRRLGAPPEAALGAVLDPGILSDYGISPADVEATYEDIINGFDPATRQLFLVSQDPFALATLGIDAEEFFNGGYLEVNPEIFAYFEGEVGAELDEGAIGSVDSNVVVGLMSQLEPNESSVGGILDIAAINPELRPILGQYYVEVEVEDDGWGIAKGIMDANRETLLSIESLLNQEGKSLATASPEDVTNITLQALSGSFSEGIAGIKDSHEPSGAPGLTGVVDLTELEGFVGSPEEIEEIVEQLDLSDNMTVGELVEAQQLLEELLIESATEAFVGDLVNLRRQVVPVSEAGESNSPLIRMIATQDPQSAPLLAESAAGDHTGPELESLAMFAEMNAAEPNVYANYSLEEYLALQELLGAVPREGDSGGYFEPIYSPAGRITGFATNSWIIAGGSGYFMTAVSLPNSIPEPAASLLLVSLFGAAACRDRRLR